MASHRETEEYSKKKKESQKLNSMPRYGIPWVEIVKSWFREESVLSFSFNAENGKQLTIMRDNISRCMSQLPVQITWQKKEGDLRERETEFGDFAYGFCLWYISHIFHYNVESQDETQICIKMSSTILSTYFYWKSKIDIFLPNHFRLRFSKSTLSDFVYGFLDHITVAFYKHYIKPMTATFIVLATGTG